MKGRLRVVAIAALLFAAITGGCSSLRQTLPKVPFSSGGHGRNLKIAIFPWAYRAEIGGSRCDLCPDRLVLAPTSREDARLVTGFFYEALTRHPRFEVVGEEVVEAVVGSTMAETAERLRVREGVDAVLVGALLEMRPRVGDPRDPQSRAGAAVYAALVEPSTGTPMWAGFLDDDDNARGRVVKNFGRLVGKSEGASRTATEVARSEVNRLVEDLVARVR